MNRNAPATVLLIMAITVLLGVLAYRICARIDFSRYCSGYLKNAADANTIDQAEKRLAIAVKYIQENELDHGYTSILWTAPNEDVGFWANNLLKSLETLRAVPPNATELERSNVLMKLRETILDDTQYGQRVTVPPGITVFPHNKLLAALIVPALIVIVITLFPLVERKVTVIELVTSVAIITIFVSIFFGITLF